MRSLTSFNRSDAKRVGHDEEKEKKEAEAIRLCVRLKKNSHFLLLCVSSGVSKKHRKERAST